MARQPCLTAPGYPHHVIQRGNNRQAVFVDDEDRSMVAAPADCPWSSQQPLIMKSR